jgi:hypothetical protein
MALNLLCGMHDGSKAVLYCGYSESIYAIYIELSIKILQPLLNIFSRFNSPQVLYRYKRKDHLRRRSGSPQSPPSFFLLL